MSIQRLRRDDLPLGGFAGLKEHRLVRDERINGNNDTWDGLGSFVYLADAQFLPNGETKLHSHKEIDVISVLVEGRIMHEGSLEHGQSMTADQAQAQRAGGEGFSHNEINPDSTKNRMIQIWALPEREGKQACYKHYTLEPGKLTRIYGGSKQQDATLDSHTIIEVGILLSQQNIAKQGEFMAYITRGSGILNETTVTAGDLIRGENLDFKATNDNVQIILITLEQF